jgi:UDP-glucose 4-epimerase
MKAGAELAISALLDSSPIRPVFLRVANAYGDRQDPARPQGIIPVAFDRVRSDRPLTIYGDTVRDFIHVRDVATALVTAVDGPVRGPLNVGSGIGISVSQLLIMIEEVAKKRPHVEQLPLRDFDVPHAVLDITRLRSLGWTPATDLDDGLRQTWRWLETTAQGGLVRPPSHRLND